MKKLIIVSALLCSLLFAPVFVSAQTAPTADALTQQLIKLLTQMIAQLEQEIQQILVQQKSQTSTSIQPTQNTPPAVPITTPVSTTPTTITCTPNWQCNSWSICTNSQQIRTCSDSNSCNTYNQQPPLTQYCSMPTPNPITTPTPVCNPSWQCGNWNTCTNSLQTRICTDSNNCNTTNGKPTLTQFCVMPAPTLTPTQQTQACQNTYNSASSSLNTSEQQTENQLNSQISSIQSQLDALNEQFAGNGTASSGAAARAEQPLNDTLTNEKAQLANAQVQYQTNLIVLNNTLQICLSSIVQNP